jgi:hypothetical protein
MKTEKKILELSKKVETIIKELKIVTQRKKELEDAALRLDGAIGILQEIEQEEINK